jgi:Uma2 family endonuclease
MLDLPPELIPNLDELVLEDDTPLDNIFTARQERLLTEPLDVSWGGPGEGRPFLALANVGLFYMVNEPPLVPDAMLAVDVRVGADLSRRENRSYFTWLLGKSPDVVIEIVSDRRGGEGDYKLRRYAHIKVTYYVIFDPENHLGHGVLRSFELRRGAYEPLDEHWFPGINLGLTLWEGVYVGHTARWLRWCDRNGRVIPTGPERADEANQRLARLEVQMRALGIEPAP